MEGSPSFGALVAGQPDVEPDVEIHGDDVAELLFTSGTTAMPKGVMLSHQYAHLAGMNFALSLSRGLRHDSDLRLLTFLPIIYHVGDVLFPLGALLSGGSVVLGRRPAPDRSPMRWPRAARPRCGPARRSSSACSRTSWRPAPSSTCRP